MHVLLIAPPLQISQFPLGLGYVAAVLEKNRIAVNIVDLSVSRGTEGKLGEVMVEEGTSIVGLTCVTENHHEAIRIARTLKAMDSDVLVVMGGVHATFASEQLLRRYEDLDVIVLGEGEYTMLDLARAWMSDRQLRRVKGISYREGKKIVVTESRKRIENLDELPYPAFHLLSLSSIEDYPTLKHRDRILPMLTSRGCPYYCVFCATSVLHGKKYRKRTAKSVVDEIEYNNKKYHANGVAFIDDIFTLDQERTEKICDEIQRRRLSIKWACSTRVDCVTPQLLRKMREAGCFNIFYGIESANDKVLQKVRKGFNLEQVRNAIRWTQQQGIRIDASFILGLPGETRETIGKMTDFVSEMKLKDRIIPNPLRILPGTELSHNPKKFGLTHYNQHIGDWNQLVSNNPELRTQDLLRTMLEMKMVSYVNTADTERLITVQPPQVVISDYDEAGSRWH
jgi:anaerobic magnesium-protoporphyrin IX monomethyl ester cyclase